jgi:hypothetical protein
MYYSIGFFQHCIQKEAGGNEKANKCNKSNYEGESVNRSQMDMKHVIFEKGEKKNIYFSTFSTDIDTLAPSLYQCVETCSIEDF